MEECERALAACGIYTCGGNLAWGNLVRNGLPYTPIDSAKLEQYMKSIEEDLDAGFGNDRVIVFAVSGSTWRPGEQLTLLSSPEYRDAVFLSLAKEIRKGVPKERLSIWRRLILSSIVQLRALPGDMAVFLASITLQSSAAFATSVPSLHV